MANDGLEVPIGVTLGRLERQLAAAEARMVRTATTMERRFGQANDRTTRGFTRTAAAANNFANGGMRNVALQLSQVAQQAQAGGGVLRALAIQLPDLTIGFGTLGIAAGIAGGAILSFLSSMRNSEDAAKLADDLDRIETSMGRLQSSSNELVDLERSYAQAIALRGSTQAGVTAATVEALSTEIELRRAILEAERTQIEAELGGLRERVAAAREAYAELIRVRDLDLSPEQRVTRNLLAEDPSLVSEQDRLDLEQRINDVIAARRDANRDVELAMNAQAAQLELQERTLSSINAALDGTAGAMMTAEEATQRMVRALESAGMDGLLADAEALVNLLGVSEGIALRIAMMQNAASLGGASGPDDAIAQARAAGTPTNVVASYRTPTVPASSGGSRRGGGGGGGGVDPAQQRMNELMREGAALTERLRTEQERYNDELARVQELFEAGAIGQETYDRALADLQERLGGLNSISGQLGTAFDRMFRGILDGSGNAADAIRAFGLELARISAYNLFRQFAPGLFGSGGLIPLPNAMGNAFSGGRVVPFARGGVVNRPTLFPMANGTGLMGEAGPEAILPLRRINGRLGVDAAGMGGARNEVVIRLDVPEGVTVLETRQIVGDMVVRALADNNRRTVQDQRRRNGGGA